MLTTRAGEVGRPHQHKTLKFSDKYRLISNGYTLCTIIFSHIIYYTVYLYGTIPRMFLTSL